MTQLISRLENGGLVRREASPEDGLVVLVVITNEGRATLARRRGAGTERLAGRGIGNALFIATSLAVIVASASGGFAGAMVLFETALGVGIAIGPLLGGTLILLGIVILSTGHQLLAEAERNQAVAAEAAAHGSAEEVAAERELEAGERAEALSGDAD